MGVFAGVDQLNRDAQTIALLSHAALEYVLNVQIEPDVLYVFVHALEFHDGCPGDNPQ